MVSTARAAAVRGYETKLVECECSDPGEWRRRIEGRAGTGIAAHHATDWSKVEAFHERTSRDPYQPDVPAVRIDTIEPLEHSLRTVLHWLGRHSP